MHSTFVPDEALTHPRAARVNPANPHSELRSGSKALAASQTRYDLFRRRYEPEFYCAVPKGQPAPAFLQSDLWQAAGEMDEAGPTPLGFDREAARIGVRLNGFYLFAAFDPIPEMRLDGTYRGLRRFARDGRIQSARMTN